MSEKKTSKPKFFQLAVMELLVKGVPFLETQHQQMEKSAKEKLGYHWNEVVMNILFNRYVKPDEKLLARYRVLLKQYRREKKARKAAKKANKQAAGPQQAVPLPPPPPIVNVHGQVDTRLTTEQTTNGAGYSYETPNFISPTSAAFRRQSQSMAQMVGATLLGEAADPATLSSPSMTPAAQSLCSTEHLNWLFENYFSTTGSSDQPTSQARLNSIKQDNERSAAAQLKQAASQDRSFSEKLDDGSTTVKVTNEHPEVDPIRDQMEGATEAQAKHVRLNRGLNALDQTLIAQPDLPKTLLDRYREQAGEQVYKDSEEKVAQYRKDPPQALPPGRTELVKEGWLVGKNSQGELRRFQTSSVREVESLPAGAQRLETRGLANGQALLREGHDFYVNLESNEVLCIPLALAPAPTPVRMERSAFEKMQRQISYKSPVR